MEYHLNLPLREEDVRKLECEDVVYLSGILYQATGAAHKKALSMYKNGQALPFNLENSAVYHNYTSFTKENDNFELHFLGATTSALINPFEPDFIRTFKIRAVLGKGGMDAETLTAMSEEGCVYLAQVGGCSALYSPGAKIKAAYWEELAANLVLALELDNFGPLTVAMDAHMNSIFAGVEEAAAENYARITAGFDAG